MDDSGWQKQLALGVLMLLIVSAVIGGLVGFASIKAADLAGIGETADEPTDAGTTIQVRPDRNGPGRPKPPQTSAPPTSSPPSTQPPEPERSPIVLRVSPKTASAYERVNLTGTYRGARDGASVQVQRQENGVWVNFPISPTSVSAGAFTTYIETGQAGVNRFRVIDTGSSKSSNTVTVRIG
jgi:hypothetical protein